MIELYKIFLRVYWKRLAFITAACALLFIMDALRMYHSVSNWEDNEGIRAILMESVRYFV